MCGITFCLTGICPTQIQMFLDIFEIYRNNHYTQKIDKTNYQAYLDTIIQNKTYISDFRPSDIFISIKDRGPDTFKILKYHYDNPKSQNYESLEYCGLNNDNNYIFANENEVINKDHLDNEISINSIHDSNNNNPIKLYFASSVLHLRGVSGIPNIQPLVSNITNNALCFNGEIFRLHIENLNDFKKKYPELNTIIKSIGDFDIYSNDTKQLFSILDQFSLYYHANHNNVPSYENVIKSLLGSFVADFALIFFDNINHKIIFGKDYFGKRSLLLGVHQNGLCLSSCAINSNKTQKDLEDDINDNDDENNLDGKDSNHEIPNNPKSKVNPEKLNDKELQKKGGGGLVKKEYMEEYLIRKYNNEYLMSLNKNWVELPANHIFFMDLKPKVANIPNIIEEISENKNQAQIKLMINAVKLFEKTSQNFEEIKEEEQKINEEIKINYNKQLCSEVYQILKRSIESLVNNIIEYKSYFMKLQNSNCQSIQEESSSIKEPNDKQEQEQEEVKEEIKHNIEAAASPIPNSKSKLAILFSGGLDSTLIARICSIIIPPGESIDLLNIAFSADAPDRFTGIKAYKELISLNPNIKFNLILIDKTLSDTEVHESNLLNLIYPKMTHMDFNISVALHLASKGEGYLYNENNPDEKKFIKSGSKIILSGLGADEIFGGYSRYRVAYLRGRFEEMLNEMSFDLSRLWIRNLGRDDRSITSNGKEVRFPFLDYELMEFISKINPIYLTNFNLPKGSGDKILLRAVAEQIGLKESHTFKKRAIQFGTKIAKLSNIKKFGSNRRAKGTVVYDKKKQNEVQQSRIN